MSRRDRVFRVGKVADQDAATGRVRVLLGDLDGLLSYWLPVIQSKTLSDQAYWMPDLDEHVVCLLDEHAEDGVVLGAIYSSVTPPPITSLDKLHLTFKDGGEFEYDRAAHKLRISLPADAADIEIETTRAITLSSSGGDVTLNVAEGQKVFLGGAGGALRVATEKHVSEIYQVHKHPTPAGLSGAPIPIGGELEWPNVSDKAVAL